jgi:glucose/mannose-6-phosphate isomerase
MWEWVKGFSGQWQAALRYEVGALPRRSYRAIVTLGMGGSAFGAEVARSWAAAHAAIPWLIVRDYRLPAWVDDEVLVIAASYSGTTEETLSAASTALSRGCTVVGLSSGGTLKTWAEEGRLADFVELPSGYAPRAAVAYSIAAQLAIAEGAGIIPATWRGEGEAFLTALRGAAAPSAADLQALAQTWQNRLIAIYAAEPYEAVALRARQQIQENAKHLAWHHTIPEMNHNEIVGLEYPDLPNRLAIWLIDGHLAHPRHRLRQSFLEALLQKRGIPFSRLICPTPLPYLSEMLWLLHAVDIFSVYLAEAHQVDPTPVPIIDALKAYLAQKT